MHGLIQRVGSKHIQAVPDCSQVHKVSGHDAEVVVFVGSTAAVPVCLVAARSKAAGRPTVTAPAPTAAVAATAAIAAPASVTTSAVAPAISSRLSSSSLSHDPLLDAVDRKPCWLSRGPLRSTTPGCLLSD